MDATARGVLQSIVFSCVGVTAAALIALGQSVPQLHDDVFRLIGYGALTAVMLGLLRADWVGKAMLLACAIVPVKLMWRPAQPPGGGAGPFRELLDDLVGGLVWGFGVLAIALAFHALARRGWRFGKFLVVGPLLGLLLMALVPLDRVVDLSQAVSRQELLYAFWLGVIAGDGAGFGAEVYDLLSPPRADGGAGSSPAEEAA